MRPILAATMTFALAAPAFAQDVISMIQKAERERDAIMAAANADVAALDWDAACQKAKDALAQQRFIAETAAAYLDEHKNAGTLKGSDYDTAAAWVAQQQAMHTGLASSTYRTREKAEE